MGESTAHQTRLEVSEKYAKGELEDVGSRELLDATSPDLNFISGVVDLRAALDVRGPQ